ncbi:MAG TPA: hypothetical protein VF992_02040 [Thermoplasmata archaeon]
MRFPIHDRRGRAREGTPAPHPPGVGYEGSLAHAPNEHIRLDDARRAMKAAAGMILAL